MNPTSLATLVVYAYASFAASWGPGPVIAREFEKTCHCQVQLVNAGDGGGILSRLKIEGEKTPADVVVGLDQTLLPRAQKELKLDRFTAFDEGPLAFVYNSKETPEPPRSLDDLLDPRWKNEIAIEDPRLSTTGLGFLLWVIGEKGEDKAWEYLAKLKKQVKVVSPSWDLAYGLFKKGKVKLVLSYWTSPAYHLQEDKRDDIKAALFKDGHYMQTEYMTALQGGRNEALKRDFLKFMLGDFAQELMPMKNFMYPVSKTAKLSPAFLKLPPKPKEAHKPRADSWEKTQEWLKKWREIFS